MSGSFVPAALLSSGTSSTASRLWDSLFNNPFAGIHHLVAFDWLILVPYFAVLGVLSCYGLHRYEMIRGYWKHRKNFSSEPPIRFSPASARHHPASDLQ